MSIRPMGPSQAGLAGAYRPVDDAHTAGLPLRYALDSGLSCAIGVLGDSTGAYPSSLQSATTWPYRLGQKIAARYPSLRVVYKPWSDAAQDFEAETVIQAGSGPRYTQFQTGGYTMGWPADSTSSKNPLASTYPAHLTNGYDIAVKVLPDWAGSAPSTTQTLVFRGSLGSSVQFRFSIVATTGILRWHAAASASPTSLGSPYDSTVAPTWTAGTPQWVRVTMDIATGTTKFYTSADGATWTQLGATLGPYGAHIPNDYTGLFEIGGEGWSSSASQFLGKIYEVRIRDGIGGPLIAPAAVDRWSRYGANSGETTVTFGGAQTLYIVNGSRAAAGLTYLTDTTRLPKMTPDYGQFVTLYNTSHNDVQLVGEALIASWSAWSAAVKARLPLTTEAVMTQNPTIAPGNWTREQTVRPHQLLAWARRNGMGVIDVQRAFLSLPAGVASVTQADGVHPTYSTPGSDGQELWTNTVLSALMGSADTTKVTINGAV